MQPPSTSVFYLFCFISVSRFDPVIPNHLYLYLSLFLLHAPLRWYSLPRSMPPSLFLSPHPIIWSTLPSLWESESPFSIHTCESGMDSYFMHRGLDFSYFLVLSISFLFHPLFSCEESFSPRFLLFLIVPISLHVSNGYPVTLLFSITVSHSIVNSAETILLLTKILCFCNEQ